MIRLHIYVILSWFGLHVLNLHINVYDVFNAYFE
jgi:hypothetical protein